MKHFVIILLAIAVSLGCAAQGRIDRVIADLENKSDVETTYSERRTVKKHKLYRITTVLNFNNENYYKRLAKAFEEERDKTITAIKNRESRTYKFCDENGTSSYTLTPCSVVKTWRSSDDDDKDESRIDVNVDPAGDTFVTITGIRSDESRKVRQRMQRELARQQRELGRQFADRQREFVKQQREFEKQQRDFEKQQREWADRQRNHEQRMRNLAGI